MKITKSQLKRIIKEELRKVIFEVGAPGQDLIANALQFDEQYGSPQGYIDKLESTAGWADPEKLKPVVQMFAAAKKAADAVVRREGTKEQFSDTIAHSPNEVPPEVRKAWDDAELIDDYLKALGPYLDEPEGLM